MHCWTGYRGENILKVKQQESGLCNLGPPEFVRVIYCVLSTLFAVERKKLQLPRFFVIAFFFVFYRPGSIFMPVVPLLQ